MPKFTLKLGHNWGVEVNELDEDAKPVYSTDGKILKVKVNMVDTKLVDGTSQSLYWPEGHECGCVQRHGSSTGGVRFHRCNEPVSSVQELQMQEGQDIVLLLSHSV